MSALAADQNMRHRVRLAIARCRSAGCGGALLLIDLDHFRALWDSHGREAGDAVLMGLAHRLRGAVRSQDTVARTDGDEFAVLLEGIRDLGAATDVARKLLALLREPVQVGDLTYFTSCSIGISLFPEHGDEATSLLRYAYLAMNAAKRQGRDRFEVFDAPMAAVAGERSRMALLLRQAAASGELSLRYQPQVEIATGRIVAVEALLRWNNPRLGEVAPAAFIPILEEAGDIVEAGAWMLRRAIAEVAAHQAGRDAPVRLSINISSRQFRDAHFLDLAHEVCQLARKPRIELEFEITESLLVDDIDKTVEKIQCIRALGIRFALDDFGTGYSSLRYLQRFPLNVLKIDRSFVAACATDPTSMAIVRTVVRLARTLGLMTVAEGVETEDQMRRLHEAGCDAAQGWLLCKPTTFAEAVATALEAIR